MFDDPFIDSLLNYVSINFTLYGYNRLFMHTMKIFHIFFMIVTNNS